MPYSSSYSTLTVAAGSLPGLRAGTKPTPSAARAPRRGQPARSIADDELGIVAAGVLDEQARASALASGSASSGVMSLKRSRAREVRDLAHVGGPVPRP